MIVEDAFSHAGGRSLREQIRGLGGAQAFESVLKRGAELSPGINCEATRQALLEAVDIDALFKFMSVFGNAIFFYVAGYVIYFCVVFRRRSKESPSTIGVQIHDAPVLEFWWTAIPTILVIVLSIYSVKIWADLQNTAGDVLTLEAIGYQFGFQFRYPKLANPTTELHLPIGTPTTIHVTSRDVIHGFWLPEFRIKVDMVPGLVNTVRITPTRLGTYRVVCSEFCGVLHGAMAGKVVVENQQDFAKWFAQQGGAQAAGGNDNAGFLSRSQVPTPRCRVSLNG